MTNNGKNNELHERMRRQLESGAPCASNQPRASSHPSASVHIVHKELSYAIVGAAIEVHRHLRPGQLEANYERTLAIELSARSIPFKRQAAFASYYKGEVVGELVADLIVNDRVIVELKAVDRVHPSARAQLLGYLRATGLRLGLLINFNEAVLTHGIKRIAN